MTPLTRRDWLILGAQAITLGGAGSSALAAVDATLTSTPPASPLGRAITWPNVRLLDGRAAVHPAAGEAASVVVFFATTCPFCARHNAHVQKLLERSRGGPLRILAVAQDREDSRVRTYLQRRGLGFDVTLDHEPMKAALRPLPGIPVTCVVDRQQRLREMIRGEMFEDDVLALAKWAEPH